MIRALIIILLLAFTRGSFSRAYYVAHSGNDAWEGTDATRPWQTLRRIASAHLEPGDQVLLKASDTFAGTLELSGQHSGATSAPVQISSFGPGRATIQAGQGAGLLATNVEHLRISNLIFVGDGPSVNTHCGLQFENSLPDRRLKDIVVDSIEVRGFGRHGIWATGSNWGFEDLQILRSSAQQNLRGGIEVAGRLPWDAKNYAHQNVTVSECRAFDNPGDPNFTQNHSGSGIVLYQVQGGRIEKCAAWNNGSQCPAKGGGPVGIWACASRDVVIEYCESFRNRSQGLDGGGFDLDGGTENCVLQYNYTHDNQGPGLMVYAYPYSSFQDRNNIVRFNISVNDAAASSLYAGLWVRTDGHKIQNLEVYNNTIVTSGAHAALISADKVQAALKNNIFLSGRNGLPLRVDALTASSKVNVQNNLYWRSGAPFLVQWNNQPLNSLEQLQKEAHQESLGEARLGAFADPGIETVSNAAESPLVGLHRLRQFKPGADLSRLPGLRLVALGDFPDTDFLGHHLKPDESAPFGAIQPHP